MSPSPMFWIDTLVSLAVGLIGLALLLLVLGVGLRQRLNQSFGIFAVCAAVVGLGSTVANISFWLDSLTLADSGGFGAPLLWLEVSATGFFFMGPALLAFATAFVETSALRGADQETERIKRRVYKAATVIGFIVSIGMLPAIFGGDVIAWSEQSRSQALRWELTSLGHAASPAPFLLQLLALILFWRNRKRLGGSALALSTAIWLIGSISVLLDNIPFPLLSLTFGISILVTGHAVTNHQIFDPLRISTERLEATVAERTRELKQARDRLKRVNDRQLRVAQISREIAQISDPAAMLGRLVELIHNSLGYHHVYVYLVDRSEQQLVIRAAAGTTTRIVMQNGHQLRIGGHSVAGQVAVGHRPRIAEANGRDAAYFADTALPGARAEMTLPLLVGGQLLGVLDLQSIQYGEFSDQDLAIMRSLADQVAVALDNARLLQETETTLAEWEKRQREFMGQDWRLAVDELESAPAYIYSQNNGIAATSLSAARSPEIARAAAEAQALVQHNDRDQATLALPITLRGQVIGALQIRHRPGRRWLTKDVETVKAVAHRLGPTLETARLTHEAQQRAAREQLIGNATDRMRETLDIETVLRTAADEMYKALRLDQVSISLSPEVAQDTEWS